MGLGARTIVSTRDAIRRLVGCWEHREVAHITAGQARARYLELVEAPGAVRSQHASLSQTQSLWRWAVSEGLTRANPWSGIKKLGKANRGKPQLTLDETSRLGDFCLRAAGTDDGALAILIAMHMGLRSGEIVSRTVRDVDGGGVYLRVDATDDFDTKTAASKRPLRIPEVLRPLVALRCAGRRPNEPLLPATMTYKTPRYWLWHELAKWCKAAEVPVICPHALRGGWASIAYEAGAMPELVAAALGHTSTKMTEAHYAQPQAVAESRRVQRARWLKPV